ncbi:serine/threonine-protein kinase SIK3 isoform X1 [Lates japonicus]|uniref:Serine/threonine-protein kinase SIK3 isoform X1 n=1 Tax=Lates japonicus TaxID=270547 RepID=A0AAD3RGQ1_LATJO|nr:serine/threonine-protein kinase SIK3 isoform X1 [Lates japonicus]
MTQGGGVPAMRAARKAAVVPQRGREDGGRVKRRCCTGAAAAGITHSARRPRSDGSQNSRAQRPPGSATPVVPARPPGVTVWPHFGHQAPSPRVGHYEIRRTISKKFRGC